MGKWRQGASVWGAVSQASPLLITDPSLGACNPRCSTFLLFLLSLPSQRGLTNPGQSFQAGILIHGEFVRLTPRPMGRQMSTEPASGTGEVPGHLMMFLVTGHGHREQ